ncbi:hypothetical protein PPUJ13061_45300 [Pseudomonas putida]|uniref:hypothetical protein n=1 Tax=Pseudomonas putida TaxID=303 RepID=UPI000A4D2A13|nr:hypothetical protein [Pseudomonas putida]ELU0816418.1 hypothetical protein [Pseudomonas putida]MCE0971494.1 hypothetical protein [Pseudomonas putida]MDD2116620.1 hypothetical protein [Pseudomonas putida]UPU93948.1 hypothetical protein M0766_06045 [Pseudomonas putida]WQE55793.1 hypothetical protein U0028_09065 [Pseudomonas putida]
MRKIISSVLVACALVSAGAYAGNGSGNPKNDLGYGAKYDQKPHYIWKDGKLVKNQNLGAAKK